MCGGVVCTPPFFPALLCEPSFTKACLCVNVCERFCIPSATKCCSPSPSVYLHFTSFEASHLAVDMFVQAVHLTGHVLHIYTCMHARTYARTYTLSHD